MSLDEFKLSQELLGHSLDVRAVTAPGEFIVSGSRDKTAKIWRYEGDKYVESLTLRDHSNFVGSVYVMQEEGWLCTGSNDATICVYFLNDPRPFLTLKGHSATVCALTRGLDQCTLFSGSWDKTARLWTVSNLTFSSVVFEGHEAAVWAVAVLKQGEKFATGSADKNVFIWNKAGQRLVVLKGHTDCVRGLTALPDGGLLSCANDAVVRHWNAAWECVRELHGHANYIYSIALNPALGEDVFVTGSEDSTIRLWSAAKGALGDHIMLPAQSVWTVACLPNGDIVTGSSDGVVRVFTRDPGRQASAELLAGFQLAVDTRLAEMKMELGGVKVNELPGPESLLEAGKQEGQTKMVRHPDGKIKCYQWMQNQWTLVGDVTGASGGSQATSGKTLFEGKEYDFVFSVDIKDDAPPIKLPYNIGEDPWSVAQKFIHKHDLPQVYLDQIANFIVKNAEVKAPIVTATGGFADPFTGEGRYIPGSGGSYQPPVGNADPFTGGSSYSTALAQNNGGGAPVSAPAEGNLDPFTGSSSYTTTKTPCKRHFPSSSIYLFESCDPSKVLPKLKEFNTKSGAKFSDTDLDSVIKLAATSPSPVDPSQLQILRGLLSWPSDLLFPVLDITRMAIRDENICAQLVDCDLVARLVQNAGGDVPVANQIMALRGLANMMLHGLGRGLVDSALAAIMDRAAAIKQGNISLQVALATLLFNLTTTQLELAAPDTCKVLAEALTSFLLWAGDVEAIYRALQALGNLTCTPTGPAIGGMVASVEAMVEKIKTQSGSIQPEGFEKLAECARELLTTIF